MPTSDEIKWWYQQQAAKLSPAMANYNTAIGQYATPAVQNQMGRNNSSTQNRGNSAYWTGSSCVTRRYMRDDTTLTIAKLPPQSEPDATIRQSAFKDITTKIEEASKPTWEWKNSAIAEIFNSIYPGVDRDAHREVLDLGENKLGACWTYRDCKLLTNELHEYVATSAIGAEFDAAERQQIRWIQYTASIDPRAIASVRLTPAELPAVYTMDIFLRAPTNQNGMVVGQHLNKEHLLRVPDPIRVINGLPVPSQCRVWM